MNSRSYRLHVNITTRVMVFAFLGFFTVLAVLMVAGLVEPSKQEEKIPTWAFSLFFLGVVGMFWFGVLSIPHRIHVAENGRIKFVSTIRKREVEALEIESIKPAGQFGFLVVTHSRGKITLLNQFDGFHEFISGLKTLNPSVELRGC